MDRLARLLATAGPVGYLPVAAGTWASAVAVGLWWFFGSEISMRSQVIIILIAILPAVWSAAIAEKKLGHDAHPIVIDEFIGQWIALIAVPKSLMWASAAFFLFRIFDVLKPPPIREAQKFPGGWGIVIDDVLAGIAALTVIHLLRTLI